MTSRDYIGNYVLNKISGPLESSSIVPNMSTNANFSASSGRCPDFLIGGAQKSGTTALHVLLGRHREIFLARPQELDFFDRDESYDHGLDWYLGHFKDANLPAVGQTSTQYLYSVRAAARIARDLPAVKLIFILRDPVERAWSHYWHCVKYGLETADFATARRLESERLERGGDDRRFFSYVDRGLYATQLQRYLERCSRERILVLQTEDLARDAMRVLERCHAFLGVEPRASEVPPEWLNRRWNAGRQPRMPGVQRWTAGFRFRSRVGRWLAQAIDRVNLVRRPMPALPDDQRVTLAAFFAAENRRLATMFDLDLSAWASV